MRFPRDSATEAARPGGLDAHCNCVATHRPGESRAELVAARRQPQHLRTAPVAAGPAPVATDPAPVAASATRAAPPRTMR